VRADLGLRDGERLVLVGGRLVHKKGLNVALDAFAALDPATRAGARLVIFGYGDLDAALKAQAAALGLGERVVFTGRVARERMPALFGAADLFLLPSVHDHAGNVDGLPNTLLEAMACGLPIVASNVVGVLLVIDDGVHGLLVPERDPAALAQAISALLSDPARAATIGQAARSRVERELTWPHSARRYLAAYESAIARYVYRQGHADKEPNDARA
jgi:glycosyltransferase involved in cell wall biosynthesis